MAGTESPESSETIGNHNKTSTTCCASELDLNDPASSNVHMHLLRTDPSFTNAGGSRRALTTPGPSASWPDKLIKCHAPMKPSFRPPGWQANAAVPGHTFPPHPEYECFWIQCFDFMLNAKIGNSVKIYQRRAAHPAAVRPETLNTRQLDGAIWADLDGSLAWRLCKSSLEPERAAHDGRP